MCAFVCAFVCVREREGGHGGGEGGGGPPESAAIAIASGARNHARVAQLLVKRPLLPCGTNGTNG